MIIPGEEAVFAPTPPLETLRMVFAHAVINFDGETEKIFDPISEHRQQVLLIDICRAHFNAPASDEKPMHVELPPDLGAPPGMCGLLKPHLYGTKRVLTGLDGDGIRAGIGFGVPVPTRAAWDRSICPRGRFHSVGKEDGSRLVAD